MTDTPIELPEGSPDKPPSTHYGSHPLLRQTINGIRLDRAHAEGGMSDIYEGSVVEVPPGSGLEEFQRVAVKFLKGEYINDKEACRRFRKGGKTAEKLNHPNIAKVFLSGDVKVGDKEVPYMVAEFIDGSNLGDAIGLSLEDKLDVLLQTGKGLDYAHSQGILHRDIKPENVMVSKDPITGNYRSALVDFDLAKVEADDTVHTAAGGVMGTYDYMSPEQARDPSNVGPPTDVYAWGATIYHVITGVTPREDKDDVTATTYVGPSVLAKRREEKRTFDIWPNEAIKLKIDSLQRTIKDTEATPKDVEDAKRELKVLVPISYKFEDEIQKLLLAKDDKQRPLLPEMIGYFEKLIAEGNIHPRELSEKEKQEEKQKIEQESASLSSKIEQLLAKQSLLPTGKIKDKGVISEIVKVHASLGMALGKLSDITPRDDEKRSDYINDAYTSFSIALAALDTYEGKDEGMRQQIKAMQMAVRSVEYTTHLEFKRKNRQSATKSREELRAYYKAITAALSSEKAEDAVSNYRQLVEKHTPEVEQLVALAKEEIIETIDEKLKSGQESVKAGNLEDANTQYSYANTLCTAIDDASVKERVTKLNEQVNSAKVKSLRTDYSNAEESGEGADHSTMLECLNGIDSRTDYLPEAEISEAREFVGKGMSALRPYKTSIETLREAYSRAEKLEKEVEKAIKDCGEKGLLEEDVKYYLGEVDKRISTLEKAIDKEEVGPISYANYKDYLLSIKEDVEVQKYKRSIDTPDISVNIANLDILIAHSNKHGLSELEAGYLTRKIEYADKLKQDAETRLGEIKKSTEINTPAADT